jgi:hypothetical protein
MHRLTFWVIYGTLIEQAAIADVVLLVKHCSKRRKPFKQSIVLGR